MEAEYLLHLVMSFKDDFWISSFLADCQRESNSSVLITVQTLELAPSACSQFDEPAFVCVDMHINNENNSRKHEYHGYLELLAVKHVMFAILTMKITAGNTST